MGGVRRMSTIPGMMLAGGSASRMGGGDKTLLVLAGRPVLAHVIARLRPQVGALALNANDDPARFAGFGLPVLADPVPGRPGPLAGVLAAMDWAAGQGAARVVTAAADTPFLPGDLVVRLRAAAEASGAPVALAATAAGGAARRHPVFGLWDVALRDALRAALGAGLRRMQDFADRHGAVSAVFAAEPYDPFFNLNTPDDLARAEALARRHRL
jgi:molybdenum cofactor guanylyltransferase